MKLLLISQQSFSSSGKVSYIEYDPVDIDTSTGSGTIKLYAEGAAMFPSQGSLLIDGEYMTYTLSRLSYSFRHVNLEIPPDYC